MGDKNKIIRNNENGIQKIRFIIQLSFALLCVWIGVEFYFFTRFLETNGAASFYERPPGVDGFLPISSFMSFYLFLTTGEIHQAHPAGLFIFLAIVLMSLVFGKSFCSWMCPIGFISELVGDFGEKVFKRRLKLPRFLDYTFRSLKYFMLGFLIYSVIFLMTPIAVKYFLDSPYNIVADIKMYYFFANISRTALIVISVLFILSIFIRNFWCRFLCPYGALLGIFSLFSPNKIQRNTNNCIDCGLCNKACPSFIKVDQVKTVISDECSTCLNCVDVCPVKDTLQLSTLLPVRKRINKKFVAVGVVVIFMVITGFGFVTGNWQNKITREEYLIHYKLMNSYGHPTGPNAMKQLNEQASKENKRWRREN
ncbi:4Fe-4S binding protein [Ignavibacterium album]|uniref:4Fe-4S binding protein n=1 Tax=Ignavibacterium album TaxID=591197 RepID=UPI0035B93603